MIRAHTRNNRLVTIGAVVVLLAAVAGAVFGLRLRTQADAAAQPSATPVSVATVAARDVVTWEEYSGRLEAIERVDLRSRVVGTVQAVHFREGALVRKGDLLVTIDPAPYAAEVERTEALAAAAEARQTFTRGEFDRARRLLDARAIAQRDHEARANAYSEAQANLRAAQAALRSARLNLSWTQVRAPVAGRAGKIEVTVGNLVSAGPDAPVLTTLVSVSPIYASFDADEQVVLRALRDLPSGGAQVERIPVRMGTAASADTPLLGRLQWVDNQVDSRSGAVRVRAVFDNTDGALMPGQFARLRMGQARSNAALLINERAVGTDQDKKYVIVVDAQNKAQWRAVTLGASVEGLRIVTSGLRPGERIVVNGLQRMRPGMVVAPQPVAMDAPPEGRASNEASAPAS